MGRPARLPWHTVAWGTATDAEIAAQLGCVRETVAQYRRRRGIAPWQVHRPWSEHDDNLLAETYWSDWTPRGRARLAAELGRTPEAIRQRAFQIELPSRAPAEERWPRSVERLERETGYEACRIRNAARKLGIELRRRGPGKVAPHFAVTEAQAERILAFLATVPDRSPIRQRERAPGAWGPGEKCLDCARRSVARASRGRCLTCYPKFMRALRAGARAAA